MESGIKSESISGYIVGNPKVRRGTLLFGLNLQKPLLLADTSHADVIVDAEGKPFRKFPEAYRKTLQQQVNAWNRRQRHASECIKPPSQSNDLNKSRVVTTPSEAADTEQIQANMIDTTCAQRRSTMHKPITTKESAEKTPITKVKNTTESKQKWKQKMMQYEKQANHQEFRKLMLQCPQDLLAWLDEFQTHVPNFMAFINAMKQRPIPQSIK